MQDLRMLMPHSKAGTLISGFKLCVYKPAYRILHTYLFARLCQAKNPNTRVSGTA